VLIAHLPVFVPGVFSVIVVTCRMLLFLALFLCATVANPLNQGYASQYTALVDIYDTLGGQHWSNAYTRQKPWFPRDNNLTNYCKWAGVLCRGNFPDSPVVFLGLSNFNASGDLQKIGPFLLSFPELQRIDFSLNAIFGSIPAQLGQLSNLESVSLTSNELTGVIPQSLSALNALTTLLLAHNNLTHGIPPLPPNIRTLDAEQNNLTGQLDNVSWPSSLNFINLGHNRFYGSFPQSILMVNKSNLLTLVLTNNTLNGTIPDIAGNMTSLQVFDISSNHFEGDVPITFLEFPPLMIFNIARNNFTVDVLAVLTGRQFQFPPSCTLAVPFLATMDLRDNIISPVDGPSLLLQLLNLLVNDKPILSLEFDTLDISPSFHPIGPPYYPNFEQGPRKRIYPLLHFQCSETLYLGGGLSSSIFLPPSFWNYSNCECAPQYWGKPPFCQQCVKTVLCEGDILALPGGMSSRPLPCFFCNRQEAPLTSTSRFPWVGGTPHLFSNLHFGFHFRLAPPCFLGY
jgi:hypothetical protein